MADGIGWNSIKCCVLTTTVVGSLLRVVELGPMHGIFEACSQDLKVGATAEYSPELLDLIQVLLMTEGLGYGTGLGL